MTKSYDVTRIGTLLLAPDGEHLAHLMSRVISCGLHAVDVLPMFFYHTTLEGCPGKAFRQTIQR
jgi:hypothetical protein